MDPDSAVFEVLDPLRTLHIAWHWTCFSRVRARSLGLQNSCPKYVAQTGFPNRHIGTAGLRCRGLLRCHTVAATADSVATTKLSTLARVVLARVCESGAHSHPCGQDGSSRLPWHLSKIPLPCHAISSPHE